jgi:hypothetical protein
LLKAMPLTPYACFELKPSTTMPSPLNLWIVFPQNLMAKYYLSFFLFIIHWDIPDNCKYE